MKISIFSMSMPEYDVATAAAKIKEWGYEGVEWRVAEITDDIDRRPISYWGKNKATIDFTDFLDNARETKNICNDLALPVCGVSIDNIYPDVDKSRLAMEGAKIMGAGMVRFETAKYEKEKGYQTLYEETVQYLSHTVDLARDFGIKALIEIREGSIVCSPSLITKVASNFDPKYLGVIFDPGNMIYEGFEQWNMALDIIGPYLAHVHVKNSGWKEVDTDGIGNVEWQNIAHSLLGGIVNWKQILTILKERGYQEWLSVEDLSQLRTTDVKLQANQKLLKNLLQRI
jgi:sugar phosphate isomerase/epimerase